MNTRQAKKILLAHLILMIPLMTFHLDQAFAQGDLYNEKYRPQYHFTPKTNWMNDPNGLVFYKGEYHMFYQYNPFGMTWGNMSWGHAISRDLVHWKHLPIALKPDELGMIFSGSAVVDEHNTSGLFKGKQGGLVAIYTSAGETQQQSIAYSTDKGRTWIKYAGNPVLPNPGIKDFRDPKVFWHKQTKKWIMAVAAGKEVWFYSSPNLKKWTLSSTFVVKDIPADTVVEVPDLVELPVDGHPDKTKWMLKVDFSPKDREVANWGHYYVGEFDGKTFTNQHPTGKGYLIDYNKDFYAALTWNNVLNRAIWIGWMNNWQYAEKIPTSPWRGAMTIPRELTLRETPKKEFKLIQNPVKELTKIRGESNELHHKKISPGTFLLPNIKSDTVEIMAEFELDTATEFGLKVRKGADEETTIGYDVTDSKLFVNRIHSGKTNFNEHFPGIFKAPLPPHNKRINMHIFVDRSSVEVFGNDGQKVITSLIFPSPDSKNIALYAKGGNVKLISMKIYDLKSIWMEN